MSIDKQDWLDDQIDDEYWHCDDCGKYNGPSRTECLECGWEHVTAATCVLPLFIGLGVTPMLISLPSVFDVFPHLLLLLLLFSNYIFIYRIENRSTRTHERAYTPA